MSDSVELFESCMITTVFWGSEDDNITVISQGRMFAMQNLSRTCARISAYGRDTHIFFQEIKDAIHMARLKESSRKRR